MTSLRTATRRFTVTLILTLLVLAGGTTPALADPAVPTTYRSEVTAVEPPTESVQVDVLGGDAFLRLRVTPGTSVEVAGYEGEPYLRFDPDGAVYANANSPAYWLNDDRFGLVVPPPSASPDSPPAWQRVGDGGAFAWHDHRIHWMVPTPPPGVVIEQPSQISVWQVPIVVDGVEVAVHGTLSWVPPTSPIPWLLAIVGFFAAAWFIPPLLALALASALALTLGLIQALTSPLGFATEILSVIPPLLALLLALLGWRTGSRLPMLWGLAGLFLLIWSGLRVPFLTNPVLPIPIDPVAARLALAGVIGATAAAEWRLLRNVSA